MHSANCDMEPGFARGTSQCYYTGEEKAMQI